MKPWSIYIVNLILLLLLVGCGRNSHSPPEEIILKNNPEKINHNPAEQKKQQTIESRFQLSPEDIQNTVSNAGPGENNDFQYYRPAEHIGKPALIPANRVFIKNRHLKERGIFLKKYDRPGVGLLTDKSRTSGEVVFIAVFDNDIFDYTDIYYTNGIMLELYHPVIGASPFAKLLPGLKNSVNYYSVNLVQNMYTPLKLEDSAARVGDRPFASYLTIGHQKISLSPDGHRRLQSEFTLGVIGPASLGRVSQDLIHTHEPIGWVNQVQNDAVINYSLRFDQGLYSGKKLEIAVIAGGQAGTLYDNIMAGVYLQAGKTNNRYSSVFQTTAHQKPFKKRLRYYFALDLKNKLVIYDATLQGGMFNSESVYKLDESQVNRYVFIGTASFGLGLGRYSLEAEQVFLTPEFEGGRHHLWFRIKTIISLN
jgi:lipid A 3-O-deacylase